MEGNDDALLYNNNHLGGATPQNITFGWVQLKALRCFTIFLHMYGCIFRQASKPPTDQPPTPSSSPLNEEMLRRMTRFLGKANFSNHHTTVSLQKGYFLFYVIWQGLFI